MPIKKKRRTRRPISRKTYLVFFLIFTAILVVAHSAFLTLPLYWDEAGQFVPAALDLYHSGFLIPRSVTPNAHPPGVMAYLAAVWTATGYSILATRVAMLLLGALTVLAVFLLCIKLCAEIHGTPAFAVVLLLLATPLFYSQSMLAQLDMPSMLLTTIALLLFLEDRIMAAALVCVVLVLVKETGIVTPLIFAIWLGLERRFVQAASFLAAPLALGLWFLALHHQTGSWFGSPSFTQYNVESMQHPVRIAFAFAKRLYHLFWEDLRFIGALAILYALMQDGVYATRNWRVAWTLAAAYIVMFSVIGGAMLERYLLPALPVVYIGMIAALYTMPNPWRLIGQLGLIAGAVVGNFWNPPYPYPFENNLAFTDFVKLHQTAADYLEQNYPTTEVATAWPFSAEISKPELGYVKTSGRRIREIRDFGEYAINGLDRRPVEIFVLFSRQWDPPGNLMRNEIIRKIWTHFFSYETQIAGGEVDERFHLKTVAAWSNQGQWIEIHAVEPPGVGF